MRVVVGGIAALVVLSLSVAAQTPEKAPVTYRVSFPAPEHRFAQVEVTFPQLPSHAARSAHEPFVAWTVRAARVRQERLRRARVQR